MRESLGPWGWSPAWEGVLAAQGELEPGFTAGRVTAVFRDQCLLRLPEGERTGEVTGRFRHLAPNSAAFPAVGDWAVVQDAGSDLALVHAILPRRNVVSRKEAGTAAEEQILAANVDVAFVMTAFDADFNLRRIERYAVMVRQSGIEPVVLLNKSDLAESGDERMAEAIDVNPGGTVHRLSARAGEGLDVVGFYLAEEKTGIFLGSSGVGKSTLLNALLGGEVQRTSGIRLADGRGRHTTTARQMFMLPGGGLVIDTPGLREIQPWADDAALAEAFSEIAALGRACRFADCTHGPEVGCAVKDAVASGALPADRYESYLKLRKEMAYLRRKADPVEDAENKRRWKTIHKSAKALYRYRDKTRD
jgi:ribosome biogenesis GTPase / thiamine phosphate phosphatase